MLANAEMHVARGVVSGLEVFPRLHGGVVRRREIGRAADELRGTIRCRVEHGAERGAAGDGAVLLGERRCFRVPVGDALARQPSVELRGVTRIGTRIVGVLLVPVSYTHLTLPTSDLV